jgi:S-methylmethionine-dependent homocysteine/selenocysteine methylase
MMGPRGDGYVPGDKMTSEAAAEYHAPQVQAFADAGADLINLATVSYPEEAIGLTMAAKESKIPVVIGFTLETDGKLPDGISLKEAVEKVDAATDKGPVYYMINCAHPTHFLHLFKGVAKEDWMQRIGEVRCNASDKSHAELDECKTLDRGDLVQFGKLNGQLKKCLPSLKVFGGCCGTNGEHLENLGVTLKTLF